MQNITKENIIAKFWMHNVKFVTKCWPEGMTLLLKLYSQRIRVCNDIKNSKNKRKGVWPNFHKNKKIKCNINKIKF